MSLSLLTKWGLIKWCQASPVVLMQIDVASIVNCKNIKDYYFFIYGPIGLLVIMYSSKQCSLFLIFHILCSTGLTSA